MTDFLVDISSVDNRSVENEEASQARVTALTNAWVAHVQNGGHKAMEGLAPPVLRTVSSQRSRHSHEANELHRVLTHDAVDQKRPAFWVQTQVLTSRAHRNVYRNIPTIAGLIAQGVMLGIVVGVTYIKLPPVSDGVGKG